MDAGFWEGKRVFITGHTGFKGSWLCLWLYALGAKITGYALPPPTVPSLYEIAGLDSLMDSVTGDICDSRNLNEAVSAAAPEVVIHMAAQSLVRESYRSPLETYRVNVIGTANLFESVRNGKGMRAVINVTSDKCYENREWLWGYRENDALGGYDPYSSSKACSELVTASYRAAFLNPSEHHVHGVGVASARSGNVIGGGDWAADRLIPDCIRSLQKGEPVVMRNPGSLRPWQHVLEPLSGYLVLAQKLWEDGPRYSGAWNFGPDDRNVKPVEWLVGKVCDRWGGGARCVTDRRSHPHEARHLKLDCSRARAELGWYPRWDLERAIDSTVQWVKAYERGEDIKALCMQQITQYTGTPVGS
jgi:CDP-glucose 4,6-dehydratase